MAERTLIEDSDRGHRSVTIRPVSCDEWLSTMQGLALDHWREIDARRPRAAAGLDINEDHYRTLDRAGALLLLGAFSGDQPIGYASAFLTPHHHYAFTVAWSDALYLAREFRLGRTGLDLIHAVESTAKQRGAHYVVWSPKISSALHRIMCAMEREPEEQTYWVTL